MTAVTFVKLTAPDGRPYYINPMMVALLGVQGSSTFIYLGPVTSNLAPSGVGYDAR